ncbi:hypothetical protein [Klebsiella pneumoniae]|uniref:hypothetical protein n=1 Tax=Klebsiella pneumoniae TaxID=573 RepID=UPI000F623160|nr:hypothetical protein [Klebsiella pneumoniae]MBS2833485.1 hypothetical protein [Klebsiella pneumoniae]MCM5953047.1 hypothetical protein [Klebsiella pneumoniae]MCX9981785.1 hypothetical protein [Klebsiella pneumoniae]MCX9997426.1 hypothetical protein [Klebsiella pneumoniae]MDE1651087.1 hypothetical protein [Klebsiella pneumoniae]
MNPWGAIIAALIAGFIAFIGMVIAKENKISEFRQEWIKELRGNIAKLFRLYGMLRKDSGLTPDERTEKFNELNEIIATIGLHLNHGNPSVNEQKLLESISRLNLHVEIGEASLPSLFDSLTENSHLVLKEEWERVKRGERNYHRIKDFLFLVFVFCTSLLLIFLVVFSMIKCGILSATLLS